MPYRTTAARRSRRFLLLLATLAAVGIAARIAPLLNIGGRLFKQFPTEDGYLTLTIARNMARGMGMSVSDGTIATNGTQPLVTWLWSVAFATVHTDRVAGLHLILFLEVALSMLTATALFYVGRRLFRGHPLATATAALAAAAHFASPHTIQHSMNCLETGAYAAVVLLVVGVWMAIDQMPGNWSWPTCVAMGLVLGLAFWVRNDAVFLTAAVCLVHAIFGWWPSRTNARAALVEAVIIGSTVVVVASPWLFYNWAAFGHLVPISGIAESHQAQFAQNLGSLPTKGFEYLFVFAAIPQAMEGHLLVILATTAVLIGVWIVIVHATRHGHWAPRPEVWIVVLYGAAICSYYGLFFGAGHFMARYLFPLSPFLALGFAHGCLAIKPRIVRNVGGIALVLIAAFQGAALYARGDRHLHEQVVDWTDRHVSEEQWVGAIQSGTLGYFHDRTINLDGKVNPDALEAKLDDAVPQYVASMPIDYLVDWVGIATWLERPIIADRYRLILHDEQKNLAVLERKTRPRRPTRPPVTD